MRGYLFQGVRNVDRLSIEGYVPFSAAPRGRSRRRILWEESAWRQGRTRTARTALGRRFTARMRPSWQLAPSVESGVEVDVRPDRLARIYRGLRKSLEESKDYAGASDFYFPQGDEIDLTEAGQAFQIVLRVIGPVLIGLTALALRSRIKR